MRELRRPLDSKIHPKETSREKESNSLSLSEKLREKNLLREDVGKATRPVRSHQQIR